MIPTFAPGVICRRTVRPFSLHSWERLPAEYPLISGGGVPQITWLTPNEHEAKILFGADTNTEELLKAYPEKLVITLGSDGVAAAKKDGTIIHVPVRPAKVADTTGAGDTLNGAFCTMLAENADLESALRFANTAASLSTEKFGAQTGMPTREEVEKELNK